jgi:hypothetical protein
MVCVVYAMYVMYCTLEAFCRVADLGRFLHVPERPGPHKVAVVETAEVMIRNR